jgi:hypothetical protein
MKLICVLLMWLLNKSNMTKNNDIENELDAIRDKIYQTTQKMSAQEKIEYINSHAHEILKEQQLKAFHRQTYGV